MPNFGNQIIFNLNIFEYIKNERHCVDLELKRNTERNKFLDNNHFN